jgi:hypothetical protein
MIGLITSIIVFNLVAFKVTKLSANKMAHIWTFTVAFQLFFDVFVDFKYHAYWYFSKSIDWESIPAHLFIVPPVNIIFLTWFPFGKTLSKKILYMLIWEVSLVMYELFTLIPQPIGYFHYGWWKLGYSAALDPVLLIILLRYNKFVSHLEERVMHSYH